MIEYSDRRRRVPPDAGRFDVRSYLQQDRDGRLPASRIRLHADEGRRHRVVSVLVAGFGNVEPKGLTSLALLEQLRRVVHGSVGVVIYHRDSSPHLAAWLGRELIAQTSVKAAQTLYLPPRGWRSGR